MPSFDDFSLLPATRAVLAEMEISVPSPIQAEAIPAMLAGHDLVGQSATGSGKTLAYSIPLIERLAAHKRQVQALVLVPTRELAVQVHSVLSRLARGRRMTTALLVGGRPYGSQLSALRYGAQIVVGTPGRVKDHMERNTLSLSHLRMCILDEADQMLDSGFGPEIERILSTTPEERQMAMFSATMPEWIVQIEQKYLKDPVRIEIAPATGAESTIEQIAYQVPQSQKIAALCTLLHSSEGESSLVFGKTKYGVEKLGKQLSMLGYAVGTLHSNKSQRAREEVLSAFRRGRVQTLLATNVAARGLDIQGIHQVINYELPESSELFTHRIGRTGRMGHQGKAITLLTPSDVGKFRRMSRALGQHVALQRLTIDEDAMVERPLAVPETPEPEIPESYAPRSEHHYSHGPSSHGASHGRGRRQHEDFMPVENEQTISAEPRRRNGRKSSERPIRIPSWQERQESEDEQPRRERPAARGRRTDENRHVDHLMPERRHTGEGRRRSGSLETEREFKRNDRKRSRGPIAMTTESGARNNARKPGRAPHGRRAIALARENGERY